MTTEDFLEIDGIDSFISFFYIPREVEDEHPCQPLIIIKHLQEKRDKEIITLYEKFKSIQNLIKKAIKYNLQCKHEYKLRQTFEIKIHPYTRYPYNYQKLNDYLTYEKIYFRPEGNIYKDISQFYDNILNNVYKYNNVVYLFSYAYLKKACEAAGKMVLIIYSDYHPTNQVAINYFERDIKRIKRDRNSNIVAQLYDERGNLQFLCLRPANLPPQRLEYFISNWKCDPKKAKLQENL